MKYMYCTQPIWTKQHTNISDFSIFDLSLFDNEELMSVAT